MITASRFLSVYEYTNKQSQDKRQQEIPSTAQPAVGEIVVVLEFPRGNANENFSELAQSLDTAFNGDNSAFRVEQEIGENGALCKGIVHLKDKPNAKSKLDSAIANLSFNAKFINGYSVQ